MTAAYTRDRALDEVYFPAVAYLVSRGWRREELGSGWWWREGFEEATLGGALEQQLDADEIDQRIAIPDEPQEVLGMTAATMDYPTAWAFVKATDPADHHDRCSWRTTNGALLCDCDVIWNEYDRRAES